MMFFTRQGRCYWLRCMICQKVRKTARVGVQNMLSLEPGDKIDACIKVRTLNDEEFNNTYYLRSVPRWVLKKTPLVLIRMCSRGVNAIKLNEGDEVIDVRLTDGKSELVIADLNGRHSFQRREGA